MIGRGTRRLPELPAAFWWLWAGSFLSALASFVFPFLGLYLTSHGLNARRSGAILALLGVGGIAAGPLGGTLADRLGRKPTLLLALVTSAVSAVYLGLVRAPLAIACGVLVYGLAATTMFPTIKAMVADVLPPEERPRGYGLLYWGNNSGIAFSAWVGGMLVGRSWLGLFAVDAATTLAFAALLARRVPESRPSVQTDAGRGGWASVLRDRPFVAFVCTHFFFMLVFLQFMFALPLAVVRAGLAPRVYGNLIAFNCALILLLQPVVGARLRAFDPGRMLALASLCVGVGYGAYAFCTTPAGFYAATLVWSLGDIIALPLLSSVVAAASPVDLRGRYQGAHTLAQSLAMAAAPLLAGAVIEARGTTTLWAGCLGLGVLVAGSHAALGAARRARAAAAGLPASLVNPAEPAAPAL